jgi:hypothetical protein
MICDAIKKPIRAGYLAGGGSQMLNSRHRPPLLPRRGVRSK